MIFKDYLNILAFCTLSFHCQERTCPKFQSMLNKIELLIPSVIGLRSFLYGRQASSSKTTIQEIKVEKEIKANKVVFHLVKVKEDIADLEVDPTFDEAIFSYIDKVYIKKFNKYIYYHWVVKHVKIPLVQRRKGNHKQWVVAKLCS
jgi:hypothetical protein